MDPVIHAEMSILIRQEKDFEEELTKLEEDIPMWEQRVKLALSKDMEELADEAGMRVLELRKRRDEITFELEKLDMQKSALRYENKRPKGHEVARAEAMVEMARLGGLIDPDEASLEREIAELGKDQALEEFSDAVLDFDAESEAQED